MKRPLTILLVEDNPHNLFLYSTALRERGHHVIEANTGEKALILGALHQPDLILLDIGLPGMSGHGVAAEIRAHPELAGCPIIAVTGYRLNRSQVRQQGIDHVIEKPILPDALAQEVESWWSAHRPAKS